MMLIPLVFSIGCTSDQSAGTQVHDELMQVTIWAHGTEIYIEHGLTVANIGTDFIFHFTSEKTGKPVSPAAAVILAESEGKEPMRFTLANKETEGIFHESFVFPRLGIGPFHLLKVVITIISSTWMFLQLKQKPKRQPITTPMGRLKQPALLIITPLLKLKPNTLMKRKFTAMARNPTSIVKR